MSGSERINYGFYVAHPDRSIVYIGVHLSAGGRAKEDSWLKIPNHGKSPRRKQDSEFKDRDFGSEP